MQVRVVNKKESEIRNTLQIRKFDEIGSFIYVKENYQYYLMTMVRINSLRSPLTSLKN